MPSTYAVQPPTRARRHLTFYDVDTPSNYIVVPYNPVEFSGKIEATLANPQAVGWTGPAVQHGSTGGLSPVEIPLRFDERPQTDARRMGVGAGLSFEEARDWLTSRIYSPRLGIAPVLVTVVWPNTVSFCGAIGSVGVNITRWDATLKVRDATITVSMQEIVDGFRSAASIVANGWEFVRSPGTSGGQQPSIGLDGHTAEGDFPPELP